VEASSCRCSQIHIEQVVISCILPVFGDSNVTSSCVWLETSGFFTSFTAPKLYSCYSIQIHNKGVTHLPLFVQCVFVVCGNQSGIRLKSEFPYSFASAEILRDRILEAWKSCPRKKLVAATAVTMCWNMFSVKTCVMAGIFNWYRVAQLKYSINVINCAIY
jgi:hypothetical protein